MQWGAHTGGAMAMKKGRAGKVLERLAIVIAAFVCAVLVVLVYWLVRPSDIRIAKIPLTRPHD